MSLTKQHLIETIYQEFSSRRIKKFTLVELSQKATVSRSTIYNNFGSLEYVYKDLIEKVILKEITRDCQSYEELINNLVAYIYNNKMLCLNLYRQTVPFIDQEHIYRQIMEDFSQILIQYNHEKVISKVAMEAFILMLRKQFDNNLKANQIEMTEILVKYEHFLFNV
ncbi:TetR/AcrR family transcriptional regulator [Companilactobacillus futsaii]|uniref:HTH tetR-type domain-containing protein n=2 Tax=Companilactobacillus futsaii TaxID=938155 RepID=A0A5B7T4E5_9LACO|nr:TetR/AcrR family transcriptional regulator [Companilactobacillus futsaii]KRK91564.1 hypothetical protein FC88_GL001196 [Companilactobacillus futsaii JCM 17355]QCX25232.1 hypothetical protein FG051_08945 [Companilactobacillus futsaii]